MTIGFLRVLGAFASVFTHWPILIGVLGVSETLVKVRQTPVALVHAAPLLSAPPQYFHSPVLNMRLEYLVGLAGFDAGDSDQVFAAIDKITGLAEQTSHDESKAIAIVLAGSLMRSVGGLDRRMLNRLRWAVRVLGPEPRMAEQVLARLALGDCYRLVFGDYSASQSCLSEAISFVRSPGMRRCAFDALRSFTKALLANEEFSLANESASGLLALWRNDSISLLERAEALRLSGTALVRMGNAREGERVIRESISAHIESGHSKELLSATMILVEALERQGRDEEAIAECYQGKALASELGNKLSDLGFSLLLAQIRTKMGLYEQARLDLTLVLESSSTSGLGENEAVAWFLLGDVERANSQFEAALLSYSSAALIYKREKVLTGAVAAILNCAHMNLELGEWKNTWECISDSVLVDAARKNMSIRTRLGTFASLVLDDMGYSTTALNLMSETVFEASRSPGEVHARATLISMLQRSGRFVEAWGHLVVLARECRRTGRSKDKEKFFRSCTSWLLEVGAAELAAEQHDRAYNGGFLERGKDIDVVPQGVEYVRVLRAQGASSKADELLRLWSRLVRDGGERGPALQIPLELSRSRLLSVEEREERERSLLSYATPSDLTTPTHSRLWASWANSLYLLGKNKEALGEAAKILKRKGVLDLEVHTFVLELIARIKREEEDFDGAADALRAACEVCIESRREVSRLGLSGWSSFRGSESSVFEQYAALSIQSKSQNAHLLLALAEAERAGGMNQLFDVHVRRQKARAKDERGRLSLDAILEKRRLLDAYPEDDPEAKAKETSILDDLSRKAKERLADLGQRGFSVILYAFFEDQLYGFVGDEEGLHVVPLQCDRTTVSRLVERVLKEIRSVGSTASIRRLLQDFSKQIVHPIYPLLADNEKWLIIPTEELALFPFSCATLPNDEYLIESHVISTAPSLTSHRDVSDGRETTYDYCGMTGWRTEAGGQGSSDRDSNNDSLDSLGVRSLPLRFQERRNFGPLPMATQEIEEAARYYDSQVKLVGATKERVMEAWQDSAIIHLATHAWSNQGDPLVMSGLSLGHNSSGKVEDVMSAMDILELDLNGTELVVLSACESAKGTVADHGGIYSLQRCFLGAGARNVIGTLWRVNDEMCRELMEEFFASQPSSGSIATSLAAAQRSQLKKTPNPRHWAAWILTGVPGE